MRTEDQHGVGCWWTFKSSVSFRQPLTRLRALGRSSHAPPSNNRTHPDRARFRRDQEVGHHPSPAFPSSNESGHQGSYGALWPLKQRVGCSKRFSAAEPFGLVSSSTTDPGQLAWVAWETSSVYLSLVVCLATRSHAAENFAFHSNSNARNTKSDTEKCATPAEARGRTKRKEAVAAAGGGGERRGHA